MLVRTSATPRVTTVRQAAILDIPASFKIRLEQTQLRGFLPWRREMIGGETGASFVEAELLAGGFESPTDHPGDRPCAGHALVPSGIVILTAAHIAHQLENMAVAIRKVRHQPFAEQVAHFER